MDQLELLKKFENIAKLSNITITFDDIGIIDNILK